MLNFATFAKIYLGSYFGKGIAYHIYFLENPVTGSVAPERRNARLGILLLVSALHEIYLPLHRHLALILLPVFYTDSKGQY
ncbi:hypothetical protein VB735_33160 [Halotia wernerae UHCC 0503]|nr:hypothetical protein [Halotia wernerae UHCC 0503]